MYNKVYKLSLRIESGPLSFSIIPNYILWRKLYDTIFEYRGFLKMSRYTFSKGQGSIFKNSIDSCLPKATSGSVFPDTTAHG